jgi:hypothetical protein
MWQKDEEHCMMRSFIICALYKVSVDEITMLKGQNVQHKCEGEK